MSQYRSFTDVELILKLRQGDVAAFTEIHTRYYGLLYRHALQRLGDSEEIQDILQELFSYLWDNRETNQFETSLPAYLYTAVRNRILNVYRRNKLKYNYFDSLQSFINNNSSEPDENIRIKQLSALIEAEIAKLPSQMRMVFEMSRKSNLSHQEIADKLGISVLTVRKQVQNSLKILKVKLKSYFFITFL
ncbi:RNA polymerase sigma factor [Mucilaginibacter paludis]|uniref:RNA polymerase, sigma-24 subunit, ECF subfamily n=1 Tax=Mucilaginibacter paludis DSM 18603 TaxID=714943 RepID=H1YIY1_9SPHI|nr:RNA polymerase sigma-70 factor [Mucilaginibacter paludis]EHQ27676.1 RNA polymerase, sigma-24 subunit, ECF subfamily [Mucilaginibacter paludis DSM 18603]